MTSTKVVIGRLGISLIARSSRHCKLRSAGKSESSRDSSKKSKWNRMEQNGKCCNRRVLSECARNRQSDPSSTSSHANGGELGKFNQPVLQDGANSTVDMTNVKGFYRSGKYSEEVASCLHIGIGESEGSYMR